MTIKIFTFLLVLVSFLWGKAEDCYVKWVPAWTGRFTVKILNRGPVYNRYVILTN